MSVSFLKNVCKQVLPFYAEYSCTLYYYSTVDVLSCDEFFRHRNSEYMGCEVINGFMHLLREQFNNGSKNIFFPTQFFPNVLDEKISRSKQGEQSKLTNYVNSNKDEWKNNWEEL